MCRALPLKVNLPPNSPTKTTRKPRGKLPSNAPSATKTYLTSSIPNIRNGSTKTLSTSFHRKSAVRSFIFPPTKSASSSSKHSGSAAILIRIPPKTPSRKSTIAASLTPTNTSHPAFPGGKPIAAESTSCGAPRTKFNRIPPEAATSVRRAKAAVKPRPIRLKTGAIGIWKASGKTSKSNS